MKTIFLCIPNYVFTSDLLRTRYIEYLSSKYRVVVFTPMLGPEEAVAGNYPQSLNITYIKWPLQHPRLLSRFKLLRISLIREFDHLAAAQLFYRRPTFRKNPKRRTLRFLSWPFGWLFTANFFTTLERWLIRPPARFLQYIERFRPVLLVTATPGFNSIEAELIVEAKNVGLKTVAVDFTWDNLTTNCNHIRKTDHLIVWNEVVKKEAINIHKYRAEKIFVAGVVKFDLYFRRSNELSHEDFLRSKGLDPAKQTLIFASKPKTYKEQLEHMRAILEARERGEFVKPVNLLIRPHPLDDPLLYQEFRNLPDVCLDSSGTVMPYNGPGVSNLTELGEADRLNLKQTLMYGDVHIQYGSTLALEAAVFDKPIVNIGFLKTLLHFESFKTTHYWPIIESGAAPIARDIRELIEWINRYLLNPVIGHEARRRIVEQYIPFRDDLAYKRSIDFLEQIIECE